MSVTLSDSKATDLVRTLREAIEAIEDGTALRPSWTLEATDWCWLILDRLNPPGGQRVD